MTMSKADLPVDPEKDAAEEKPFFLNSFRECVVYAYFTVNIVLLSVVIVAILIIKYNELKDRCQCRV